MVIKLQFLLFRPCIEHQLYSAIPLSLLDYYNLIMAKPIFIVGYMGSGKSTVAKKLATRLKYDFVDIDAAIVNMTGKEIADIFREEGEDAFRQLEHSILVSLCARTNTVIATGGGAPCFYDNMTLMNKHGITVYLKMHPDSLASRIIASNTERPLLNKVSTDDMPAYISRHLLEREAFYNKAKVTIKGESIKTDELERLVINAR